MITNKVFMMIIVTEPGPSNPRRVDNYHPRSTEVEYGDLRPAKRPRTYESQDPSSAMFHTG